MADAVLPDDNPGINRAAITGIWATSKPATGSPAIHRATPGSSRTEKLLRPRKNPMTTTAVNHLPASHDPSTSLASAVTVFNSIAVSTQIPRKPDGSVELGDIREQSRQVLENLQTALARAGTDLSNVLQLTIYLTDMSERTGFNEVYEEFFPRPYPSRCAVEVSSLARTGMKVEVTAMAAILSAGI